MTGFTSTLLDKLNETERSRVRAHACTFFRYRNCHAHSQLNITKSFNYRELLLREKWNGSTLAVTALRPLFVQYQINASERYLHDLRQHMHTKVALCFVRFSPHPSVCLPSLW